MRLRWLAGLMLLTACATTGASRGAALAASDGDMEAKVAAMDYAEAAPPTARLEPGGGAVPGRPVAEPLAQALTSNEGSQTQDTATDAVDGARRVVIYTASLTVAVFEVQKGIERVRSVASANGGYVSRETNEEIQVRIPAERFEAALKELEAVGDVLSRQIQAQDVSEEFHDLTVRIRTAEKMIARLERLLERAENVEHALRVEQEIRRLTQEVEGMKGRLKFLADRASLSTVTMRFQALQHENIEQSDLFRLPFPWLDALGLDTLLNLR